MSFTYPLSFPSAFNPSDFTIDPRNHAAVNSSPFSGKQHVQDHAGEMLHISFSLSPRDRAQADEYTSFLFKLRGVVGTFTMSVPGSEMPRGSISGTPKVDGAGQKGNLIKIKDLSPSQTGVLLQGDYLQIGTQLVKNLSSVDADEDGKATIEIVPGIRTETVDNEGVIYNHPKGVFKLKKNSNPIRITHPNLRSYRVEAREDF